MMARRVMAGRSQRLWTPSEITTALWLDAADAGTITKNGSNLISQWNDKSGNSRHASQGTSGKQPTYSATAFNGYPAVVSDGVDDRMEGNLVFSGGQPDNYFIYAALKIGTLKNSGNDTQNRLFNQYYDASKFNIICSCGVYDGSKYVAHHDTYPPSGGYLGGSSAIQNNTSILIGFGRLSGMRDIWINGVSDASQTGAESYTSTACSKYGLFGDDGYHRLNASTGEIIACAYPPTSTRQKLEGYLAHKWGLTANLPADHPYKFGPPRV